MEAETLAVGRESSRAAAQVEFHETFRAVFAVSYPRLVVQLYGVTGDAAEAEDLVQEAFVRAAAAGTRFAKLDNHEAWLRTVAVNIHRSRWRKRRNFSRIRDRVVARPTDLPALEDRMDVIEALRGLPAGQREVGGPSLPGGPRRRGGRPNAADLRRHREVTAEPRARCTRTRDGRR